MKPTVLAILCSDIHLSAKPPIARAGEPDWFKAMARPLRELRELGAKHEAPILCAGDIFHKWNSPPELISFAIEHLPKMYAIPGQHDLPLHSLEDIRKSAYWTVVKAGVVKNLPMGTDGTLVNTPAGHGLIRAFAFPWGVDIHPLRVRREEVNIALIHRYVWSDSLNSYPGAPAEQRLRTYRPTLRGYDIAAFGDNHKPFMGYCGECRVVNHGGLMRRNSDEIEHRPAVYLVMSDMSVFKHYLDCSKDVIDEGPSIELLEAEEFKAEAFIKELTEMDGASVDYPDAVKHYLKTRQVSKGATQLILQSIEQ